MGSSKLLYNIYKKKINNMAKSMGKSMKRKKAMKKSKIAKGRGAKSRVFKGSKAATSGGLKKSDLTKNKDGRIVSKKRSLRGKRLYQKNGLAKWTRAVQQAKKSLGIKGFQIIGGKTSKGQALLKKARSLFKK